MKRVNLREVQNQSGKDESRRRREGGYIMPAGPSRQRRFKTVVHQSIAEVVMRHRRPIGVHDLQGHHNQVQLEVA